MTHDPQAGGVVERAGRDADRLAPRRVPEQARAALAAEAAPRPRVAVWAVDPAQPARLHEHELLLARGAARRYVTAPAAALLAVADQNVTERPGHLVADRPAEAAAGRRSRSSRRLAHLGRSVAFGPWPPRCLSARQLRSNRGSGRFTGARRRPARARAVTGAGA